MEYATILQAKLAKNMAAIIDALLQRNAALDLLAETRDRGISDDWEVRRDELLEESSR